MTTSGADAVAVLPGQRHEDWPVEDVAGKDLEQMRAIRDGSSASAALSPAQQATDD